MNFYVVNDHVYDWWIFPFQLCSLPMYLCPLLIMIHNKKRHRILCTFLLDFNMMGAVATFIDPSGIFHPYWMLTLHGILWHLMLIFVGFVIIFSHEADLTTRGFLRTLPLFAFFCLAAEVLNGILHRFSAANLFYLPMGNVHPAALWRYRSDTRPSDRHSPVHSCDGCRRLAHS